MGKRDQEKNSYPCRQHELYDTAETAWNLFVLHLGDFTKFKKSYSTKFYEERMQDLERAKSIKNRTVLQQEFTELRKEMALAKKDVLYYYRCTLQYIKGKGPVSPDKGIYFEVNKSDYKKAANNNWSSCNGIKMTLEYVLTKRKDDLIKDYDVPESFFDESIGACKTFSKLYFKYYRLKTNMKCTAQDKVKLNNIIYRDLTLLLNNAQFIYRNRKDMQQLFQFDKLLKTARKKKKNSTTAETKPAVLSFLNKVAAMF
ncbi:MAG TPA: hypothetical protein VJY62_18290 [Bacteroidia bacterium]|nr:hypothetical protein [Bacteroidia bacterium]